MLPRNSFISECSAQGEHSIERASLHSITQEVGGGIGLHAFTVVIAVINCVYLRGCCLATWTGWKEEVEICMRASFCATFVGWDEYACNLVEICVAWNWIHVRISVHFGCDLVFDALVEVGQLVLWLFCTIFDAGL